jgi:hypothetical protein
LKQVGDRYCGGVAVCERGADIGPACGEPVDQIGQRGERFVELLTLIPQRPKDGVEVDDYLADQLITVRERVRHRRGLGEE